MELNFDEEILLEDSMVRLEPLQDKHFDSLLSIALQEPSLLQFSPSPFGSESGLKENFRLAREQKSQKKRYAFAIYDKQKSRYAGSTSLGGVSNKDLRLQIGWTWLGKDFQGTGLNKNCKFLLLHYTFEHLKFERVEFFIDSRNARSRKAVENIGGKWEGELRNHVVLQDGFRRNTVIYSILKSEWPGIKKEIFAEHVR